MCIREIKQKPQYVAYLQKLCEELHPKMLTANIYPIATDNENPNANFVIKSMYYWSIEAIAEISRDKKVPFWLFMLSNKHTTYGKNTDGVVKVGAAYPYPTVPILRFQAMTAIAYGIQGLVFWTYGLPADKLMKDKIHYAEIYYDAPYKDGKTTEIWSNCQQVIREIKIVGKILLNSVFQGARHVYNPNITNEKDMIPETIRMNGQFGCIRSVLTYGKGCVITHLKKGIKNYMAIVSRDFANIQTIILSIDNSYKWAEYDIDPNSEHAGEYKAHNEEIEGKTIKRLKRTLVPGGMILFEY